MPNDQPPRSPRFLGGKVEEIEAELGKTKPK